MNQFKNFEFVPHYDYEKMKDRTSSAAGDAKIIWFGTLDDNKTYRDYMNGMTSEAGETSRYFIPAGCTSKSSYCQLCLEWHHDPKECPFYDKRVAEVEERWKNKDHSPETAWYRNEDAELVKGPLDKPASLHDPDKCIGLLPLCVDDIINGSERRGHGGC